MKRRRRRRDRTRLVAEADVPLLEVVDHVLNLGVVVSGDVMLSLAQVDLVYVRLSALLCAADRIFADARRPPPPRR